MEEVAITRTRRRRRWWWVAIGDQFLVKKYKLAYLLQR